MLVCAEAVLPVLGVTLSILVSAEGLTIEKRIDNQLEIGKKAFEDSEFALSRRSLEKALHDCREHSLTHKEMIALNRLVNTYLAMNQHELAEALCREEARRLSKTQERSCFLAEDYTILADVLLIEQKLKNAERIARKAMALAEKSNCKGYFRLTPLLTLGMVEFETGKESLAIRNWEKAKRLAEMDKSDPSVRSIIVFATNLLAIAFSHTGRENDVNQLYQNSIAKLKADGDNSIDLATCLAAYATWLLGKGRLEEADKIFNEANTLFTAFGDRSKAAQKCRSEYASLLRKLNRPDEAKKIEEAK